MSNKIYKRLLVANMIVTFLSGLQIIFKFLDLGKELSILLAIGTIASTLIWITKLEAGQSG